MSNAAAGTELPLKPVDPEARNPIWSDLSPVPRPVTAVTNADAFGQTEPGGPAQNLRLPVDERNHPYIDAKTWRSDEKCQATEPEPGSFHHRKPQAG